MTFNDVLLYALSALGLPAFGWIIRVEQKFAASDVGLVEGDKLIDEKFIHVVDTLERIETNFDKRLERMERSMNGFLQRGDSEKH